MNQKLPPTMTGPQLREILTSRGWLSRHFATHMSVNRRMVNRWCSGATPVPETVAATARELPRRIEEIKVVVRYEPVSAEPAKKPRVRHDGHDAAAL